MRPTRHATALLAALLLAAQAGVQAKLPPPTAKEAQAQAEKKAKADAQAEKDKQTLLASMDALASRWRSRAAANGLKVNAPTTVVAQKAALSTPAVQSSPSGQPGGERGPVAQQAPIRSEKNGTAPPSADVKPGPSPGPVPAATPGSGPKPRKY